MPIAEAMVSRSIARQQHPQEGIVESGVKYLKGNFLPLKTFRDLSDLNRQAKAWVMDEAGTRRHALPARRQIARFAIERRRRRCCLGVPDLPSRGHGVHPDCHIQFDAFYSVSHALVGKRPGSPRSAMAW